MDPTFAFNVEQIEANLERIIPLLHGIQCYTLQVSKKRIILENIKNTPGLENIKNTPGSHKIPPQNLFQPTFFFFIRFQPTSNTPKSILCLGIKGQECLESRDAFFLRKSISCFLHSNATKQCISRDASFLRNLFLKNWPTTFYFSVPTS